ncbi:hypothetical protein HY639_02805 [Candidatus Woesearchaeota archaeon]|nr:hypothetical protein [Candidatus Woesearchaeota archaeon]
MDNEELLLLIRRSFEKVKADIKTHDAYIQALRAENELLKLQIKQLITQTPETASRQQPSKHRNKVFIKQKILEFLSNGSRPLSEVKELIVDRETYCSKASFYRYIDSLRQNGVLMLVETDGIAFVSASLHEIK